MKRIVMIHTSPVSLNDLKALTAEIIPEAELINIIDDSLLEEVKANNGLTPAIISRMTTYVKVAESLKPDLIFNQCSSVGEAFDIAKKCTAVPALKVDEAMAEEAVRIGRRIAVVATVASTMRPSCNLVRDGALDVLMKEKNVEKHNQLVLKRIQEAEADNDVIVLAQGSMTALLPYLKECARPVLTSPRLGVMRARQMLGLK